MKKKIMGALENFSKAMLQPLMYLSVGGLIPVSYTHLGRLTRQKGYYIFYERNEAMQRYMIDTGDGESIDDREQFEDRAIKSFRAIVQEKKDLSGQKRVMTCLLYTSRSAW